jgi:hypothetical protein
MTSGRVHRPRGPLPIHPTLLAVAWVLSAFTSVDVSPYAALRPVAVAMALGVALTVVCCLLSRQRDRGGLVAAMAILGLEARDWVLPLWASAATLAVVLAAVERRGTYRLGRMTWALNGFSLILIGVIVGRWAIDGGFGYLWADLRQGAAELPPATAIVVASVEPDIYVIQLDGHPRGDWMVAAFGAPTDAFADELRRRGFEISEKARSNYDETVFTLPSMLNATYLDAVPGLVTRIRDARHAVGALRRLANDGLAFRELRAHGYSTVAIGSGWEEVALRQADVFIDPGPLNDFEASLVERSALISIAEVVQPDPWGEALRVRLRLTFAELSRVATSPLPHPAFVYAHLPAPHPPVVLDASGGAVDTKLAAGTSDAEDPARFVAQYRAQVEYVDDQALASIDEILAHATRPTVILVFSDHGSRIQPLGGGPMDDLERTSILLAIRAPGHPGLLRNDISLVNVVPALFNAYLGADLAEQPDRSYVFDVDSHTFRLVAPAPAMP